MSDYALAGKYIEKWKREARELSYKQKDGIVRLFLTNVLGESKSAVKIFRDGVYDWRKRKNEKFRKVYWDIEKEVTRIPDADRRLFWEEIRRKFPSCYSEEDVNFLSEIGNSAITHMLIEMYLTAPSLLLEELGVIFHNNK